MERPLYRVALRALWLGAAGVAAAVLLVLGAGSASAEESRGGSVTGTGAGSLPTVASPVAKAAQERAEPVLERVEPVLERAEPVLEKAEPVLDAAPEPLDPVLDDARPAAPPAGAKARAARPEQPVEVVGPAAASLEADLRSSDPSPSDPSPSDPGPTAVEPGGEPGGEPADRGAGATRTWAAPAPSWPRVSPTASGTPLPPAYLPGGTALRLPALGVVTHVDHTLPSSLPARPGTRPD